MLRLIILIIIAVIVLGYFGIDVRNVIDGPVVAKNLAYLKGLFLDAVHAIINFFHILFAKNA